MEQDGEDTSFSSCTCIENIFFSNYCIANIDISKVYGYVLFRCVLGIEIFQVENFLLSVDRRNKIDR